jgi:hypothetical protein
VNGLKLIARAHQLVNEGYKVWNILHFLSSNTDNTSITSPKSP